MFKQNKVVMLYFLKYYNQNKVITLGKDLLINFS